MKSRKPLQLTFLVILIAIILLLTATMDVFGYGNNFIFPAARRYRISTHYEDPDPNHHGYDYPILSHTKITAIKYGTVAYSHWGFGDGVPFECNYSLPSYGNLIILTHSGDVTSRYAHLSNTGTTPAPGATFNQGSYMALSDDTGCSGGDHLHLETRTGGTWGNPFDPYDTENNYANPDWVSGWPIPAGYRDQDGAVHGPYSLSGTKIREKWVTLEGSPGSPVGGYYYYSCGLLAQGFRQNFERGYIDYCGSGNANYHPYTTTFLPDIRYRQSIGAEFNSTIVVRNNSDDYSAQVNITIYHPDGRVFDTRTHTSLTARAMWVLEVHDIFYDSTMYGTGTFVGSATVSANQDVSVLVMHHMDEQSQDYTGIPSTINAAGIGINPQVYIPAYLNNYYCWDTKIYAQNAGTSETTIYAEFYDPGGNQLDDSSIGGVKPGGQVTFSDLYTGDGINDIGSVKVLSSPSQNLAALLEHECETYDMSFEYEGISQ